MCPPQESAKAQLELLGCTQSLRCSGSSGCDSCSCPLACNMFFNEGSLRCPHEIQVWEDGPAALGFGGLGSWSVVSGFRHLQFRKASGH